MAEIEHDPVASWARRMRLALASDDPRVARLAEPRISVCLSLRGSDEAVSLLLDRTPVEVIPERLSAEVELELDRRHLEQLAMGRLSLQAAIMRGEISYRGPVRKLLAISAVIRSLMRAEGETAAPAPGGVQASAASSGPFVEREPGDFWAIECRELHKRFGEHKVLQGVDVAIPAGLITAVLGPSGAGKSVLLKHMVGLISPDRGQILVHGTPIGEMTGRELLAQRRAFGISFQDGALWSSVNLYDNVALPLRQHTDLTEREIADEVHEILGRVGLREAERRMPYELSGGMRKRAGFARALVLNPEFLFFDEPDSGLDPVRTALLSDLIASIHAERGGTFVIITHDVALARRIAEYLVILWQGQVVEVGLAEDVFASPQAFVRQFLAGETAGPLGME